MKRTISFVAAAAFCAAIVFTSCKKDNTNDNQPSETEMNTHADDQNKVASDMDDITNELNGAIETRPDFAGRTTQTFSICNAVAVADTFQNQRRLTITFNGDNCAGTRTRNGVVVATMPLNTQWKNAGAAITVTYQNLKITRKADGKFVTISGSHVLTNVTGGLLVQLAMQSPQSHTITSSGMAITFMDGSQRNWQVARKRDFTYNNGVVMTVTGTQTVNGITGVTEWGSDRFNRTFVTSISQPVVVRQDCAFRITSGQVKHNRQAVSATVTFGLNQAGAPAQCSPNAFFMKIEWTGPNGNTHSHLMPY